MLTKTQKEFMGVFYTAPISFRTFWTTLVHGSAFIKITKTDTIAYDEVEKSVRKAKILGRREEFPIGKQDGHTRKAVAPDIIKDSLPITPMDSLGVEPGQSEIVINGMVIDNKNAQRDMNIATLKGNLYIAKEDVSAEMILKQTYSPENGSKLTFGTATNTAVDGANTKLIVWLDTEISAYQKKNKVYPTHLMIGSSIFSRMIGLLSKLNNVQMFESKLTQKSGDEGIVSAVQIGAHKLFLMPAATDAKDVAIENSNTFMFYHINAVVPAYAGLTNVVNGKSTMEAATELVREISANEKTGDSEMLCESAYIPVLVNKNLIKRYAFSNTESIEL